MTKLTCQVNSCANNLNSLCSLSNIKVDGPAAIKKDQTCCSSYYPKAAAGQNAVTKHAVEDTEVFCKVANCSYNSSDCCHARAVSVDGCCQAPSSMSDTECCSFTAK